MNHEKLNGVLEQTKLSKCFSGFQDIKWDGFDIYNNKVKSIIIKTVCTVCRI